MNIMTIKTFRAFALCILFSLVATTLLAATPLDTARARISEKAASVSSIQSRFKQEKHLSIFREMVESTGLFSFAKPDKLRWEMTTPIKTGFVINGGEGRKWHELIEGEEHFSVERDPVVKAVSDQLMSWATADFEKLDTMYTMELLTQSPVTFRMTPIKGGLGGAITSIDITFSADNNYVTEVLVNEDGGDFTRITFAGVRINAEIAKGTF